MKTAYLRGKNEKEKEKEKVKEKEKEREKKKKAKILDDFEVKCRQNGCK